MSETFKNWTRCECGTQIPPDKECPICSIQLGEKKAAVVLDSWKLPIFLKVLDKHNYKYAVVGELVQGIVTLVVITDDLAALKGVLITCENRCKFLNN